MKFLYHLIKCRIYIKKNTSFLKFINFQRMRGKKLIG